MRSAGLVLVLALAGLAHAGDPYEPTEADLAQEAAARAADYRARGHLAESRGELRDALSAYDQALSAEDTPEVAKAAERLRERVNAHDDALNEGRELARDPDTLEDAIEAYGRARAVWASVEVREALREARRELAKLKAAERTVPPTPTPTPTPAPEPLALPPVAFVPVFPVLEPQPTVVPLPFDPVGDDPYGLRDNRSAPPVHRIAGLLIETGDERAARGCWAEAVQYYEKALKLLPDSPLAITRLNNARAIVERVRRSGR